MKRTLFQRVYGEATAEVMEQFPFPGVKMLHEMTMRFGPDLAKKWKPYLNEMAPNIIRNAKEGSQKNGLFFIRQQKKYIILHFKCLITFNHLVIIISII